MMGFKVSRCIFSGMTVTALLVVGQVAMANAQGYVSELEAKQAFDKAVNEFNTTLTESGDEDLKAAQSASTKETTQKAEPFGDVAIVSNKAVEAAIDMPETGYAPISDIRLTVDLEGKTLQQIVDAIVEQAKPKAGVWEVKWRLQPKHDFILKEKVNLTAETTFDQFMTYLSERVNNMTGVSLFVSVFDASRIIVISDTYY